jgi:hypothetical protein
MQRAPLPPHYNPPQVQPRWRSAIARPQVWLSGLGILGLALLGWQFSQRPDWQKALAFDQPNGEKGSDASDTQVGADIDSLSALNAELGSTPLLDPKLSTSDALAQLKATEKAAATANKDNPLSLESLLGGLSGGGKLQPNGLTSGLGSSNGTGGIAGLNAPGFSFTSGLNASTNLANRPNGAGGASGSNSLLDSALNRYSPAATKVNPAAPFAVKPSEPKPVVPTPNPAITPIEGNSGFEPIAPSTTPSNPIAGTSRVNPALLSNPNPELNSYTGLTNSATLPDSPVYSRPIDRGVAAPSAILGSPSSSNIAVPIGSTPMPPGGGAIPIAVPPAPPDRPFSVPRSAPGQSMGGGEIRSFSNP